MTQHSVYSPSSAHRWTQCTASAEAIAMLPEQEESDAAREGTEAHEELERVLSPYHDRPGTKLDADVLLAALDQEHPSAYGIALMLKYAAGLPAGRFWIEQRVELTPAIHGTLDLGHWDPASETVTIMDLKMGFVDVQPDKEQLKIYGVSAVLTFNLPAKWVRLVVVQPNSFMPGPRVKQIVIPMDELYAWAQGVAGIPQGPLTFKAGEHCRYCRLFGICEPTRDLLAKLSVSMQHTPEEVSPAQRVTFLTLKRPLEDWFKNAEKSWAKDAMAGKTMPGLKLVQTMKHRAWKDESAARRLIMEKLGPDALDVPTPAAVEKLGLDVAVLTERPDGGPALAFASDKRAEWKAKSAAEMFKDAVGAK